MTSRPATTGQTMGVALSPRPMSGQGTDGARGRTGRPALLTNVQVLRGLAALSVAVFHAQALVTAANGNSWLGVFDERFGLMGVAVFFAISGYLMARLVRASDPATFLAHRILRILPPFLALAAGIRLLSPLLEINVPFHPLALTLAPVGPAIYPLGGEWTLVCETTFYVGMFLIGLAGLQGRIELIAVLWLALLAAIWLATPWASAEPAFEPIHTILLSPPCAAFAGGLLLPRLTRLRLFPPVLALAAGPLAIASGAFASDGGRWVGGAAAVIWVGCAVQAPQLPLRGRAARALVHLGDWSYVLYLVHMSVVTVCLARLPAAWSPTAVWAVGVLAALAAAAVLGPLDVWAYRHLKRWADRMAGRGRWALCLVYLGMFWSASLYGSALTALGDYRSAKVERVLARLPPDALLSPEAAQSALRANGLAAPASLRAAADRTIPLPPNHVFLEAWAVDEDQPATPLVLTAWCEGRRVAAASPGRRRPDIAAALGRTDLRRRNIGFLVAIRNTDCPRPASIVTLISDQSGRSVALALGGSR